MMRPDPWGHSEPDADPCGYRASWCFSLPKNIMATKGLYERAMKDPQRAVRQKAIELVAMVESEQWITIRI